MKIVRFLKDVGGYHAGDGQMYEDAFADDLIKKGVAEDARKAPEPKPEPVEVKVKKQVDKPKKDKMVRAPKKKKKEETMTLSSSESGKTMQWRK